MRMVGPYIGLIKIHALSQYKRHCAYEVGAVTLLVRPFAVSNEGNSTKSFKLCINIDLLTAGLEGFLNQLFEFHCSLPLFLFCLGCFFFVFVF